MALRTVQQYKESLRDGRRLYILGRKVADVTTDRNLQITTDHSANIYSMALDPRYKELATIKEDGDVINRYFLFPKNAQDLEMRRRLIDEHTRLGRGQLNLTKAVGSDCFFALTAVTHLMDKALKTDYSKRVAEFVRHVKKNDLSLATAQTDAKGDRALRPHEQADPDVYVHMVERRKDGIVVRGAKAHTTAGPVVNELLVIPTRAMQEQDKDYAVAFAVPADAKGLTLICRPTGSIDQSDFDNPISRYNVEVETLTVFDDVFVPWERVFMCGEWQYAGALATTFANFHRFTAISYKPPTGDLFVGAAQLIAEANGVEDVSHIREKVAKLIQYTEMIRACGIAAAQNPVMLEPGIALPSPLYCNIGKHHFASQFHEAVRLLQDVAGGFVITAPSEKDLLNPETGDYVRKYLVGKKGVSTEHRLKLFSLIRDLTASNFGGLNFIVTLHGEGSLAAQTIAMLREYDVERCKRLVKEAIGIN